MDEVFGEENFVAQVVVNLNAKGRQLGRGFATSHEYLLVYARDADARARSTRPAPDIVDPRGLPADRRPTAGGYRHLPLRNTNKKFNPVDRADPALRGLGRPGRPAGSPPSRSPARSRSARSSATDARRSGAGRRPLIDQRPDDLVCRRVNGRTGERVDVFQKDWLPRRAAPQEAAHHLAGRGGRLDRHRGRRAQGRSSATSSSRPSRPGCCAGSSRPCPTTRWCSTSSPAAVRRGTRRPWPTSPTAAPGSCLSSTPPSRPGRAPTPRTAGYATVADITRARLQRSRRPARRWPRAALIPAPARPPWGQPPTRHIWRLVP